MGGLKANLKRWGFVCLTGYILYFYSEKVFWGHFRADDCRPSEILSTVFAYSLLAYVLLASIYYFRARQLAALFLCGGLFGWFGEGILVQTMYQNFPLNISCTGLSWHALLTTVIGWFGLRRILIAGQTGKTARVSAWMGLFWALWSVFWWSESGQITPFADYCLYALSTTTFLVLAYWLYDCFVGWQFKPAKWDMVFLCLFFFLLFVFWAVPRVHQAVVVFPATVVPTLLLLWRYRLQCGPEASSPDGTARNCTQQLLAGSMRPVDALCVFAMPLVAVVVYGLLLVSGIRQPYTGWLVYLVTVPAGFIGYIWAAVKILRPGGATDSSS